MLQNTYQAYEFDDLDFNKSIEPESVRSQLISPWVQNRRMQQIKHKKNYFNQLPEEINERKKQFLSTIHANSEHKRGNFRNSNQKAQKQLTFAKFDRLKINVFLKDLRSNILQSEKQLNYKNQEKAEDKLGKHHDKKTLNTTMYVYQQYEFSPRKVSKINKKSRAESFGYEVPDKSQQLVPNSLQKQKQFGSNGSKNLQRILKMKQKMRVKNNYLVKKIKQKQIQSDKQITIKQLQQLHNQTFRNWRSITLDGKRTNTQKDKSFNQKKHPDTFFRIKQPDMSFLRNMTAKYFK